jgi:amino acid transporter
MSADLLAISEKSKLKRTMGFWDLVWFYIAAVVGLRWIATAARVGPSAISIWLLALILFFMPLALAVTELSSRYPEEGGIYVWSKRAFGDFHAFMAGWTYWTSNIVYFPGLLFFASSNAAYVMPRYSHLAGDKTFIAVFSIFGLLVALTLNIVGLRVGKWLHNVSGSVGTWLPALILILMGLLAWAKFGAASDFRLQNLLPGAGRMEDIAFWASIAFAFGGLESASIMGEEVKEARRNIPMALLVAGLMITFIYVAGTAALLLALPQQQASSLNGILDAIKAAGERAGLGAWVAAAAALFICLGNIGGVGAWIAATARLPFVAGLDRYLPSYFGRIHPRWGTPHRALLVQAALAAAFIVMAGLAGRRAEQAYNILVSLGVIAYFIPYLYLFASFVTLHRERRGRLRARLAGSIGFLVTAAAIVLASTPDHSVEDRGRFFATIFGTMAVNLASGALVYAFGKRRRLHV